MFTLKQVADRLFDRIELHLGYSDSIAVAFEHECSFDTILLKDGKAIAFDERYGMGCVFDDEVISDSMLNSMVENFARDSKVMFGIPPAHPTEPEDDGGWSVRFLAKLTEALGSPVSRGELETNELLHFIKWNESELFRRDGMIVRVSFGEGTEGSHPPEVNPLFHASYITGTWRNTSTL